MSKEKQIELKDEDIEIELLLRLIYLKYGYDFSEYNRAYINRRIKRRTNTLNLNNISKLTELVLYNKNYFDMVFKDISIGVTEMYRFPSFYKAFRKVVIPVLKTYSSLNIWHAGCSTGEEVYSMAILLHEEGLLNKSRIYATDINEDFISSAKEGIYSVEKVKEYSKNYQLAGGKRTLSDYYKAKYNHIILDEYLRKKILFYQHNLVSDNPVVTNCNVIVCRNVLIYFKNKLQNIVLGKFYNGLTERGFLALGSKEGLLNTQYKSKYTSISRKNKIYRKL